MAIALDASARRFSALFQREIVPHLSRLEAERQQRRSRLTMTAGGFATAALLSAWTLWPLSPAWALAAGAGLAMLGLMLAGSLQRRFRARVRELVMPAVCQAIGGIEHTCGHAPGLPFHELVDLGLLPSHDRLRIDDVFSGRHRETGFVMAEARLLRRGARNRMRTVFRGLVLAIDVPHKVPARILIARDAGSLGNYVVGWVRRFRDLERVPLPDHDFERRFAVYGDRPEVARETLGPALREALVSLAETHPRAPLQAAFVDRRFYLVLPKRGDRFKLGSLFRPLSGLEGEARRVLNEVTLIHRVIDTLHGDLPAHRRTSSIGAR